MRWSPPNRVRDLEHVDADHLGKGSPLLHECDVQSAIAVLDDLRGLGGCYAAEARQWIVLDIDHARQEHLAGVRGLRCDTGVAAPVIDDGVQVLWARHDALVGVRQRQAVRPIAARRELFAEQGRNDTLTCARWHRRLHDDQRIGPHLSPHSSHGLPQPGGIYRWIVGSTLQVQIHVHDDRLGETQSRWIIRRAQIANVARLGHGCDDLRIRTAERESSLVQGGNPPASPLGRKIHSDHLEARPPLRVTRRRNSSGHRGSCEPESLHAHDW